MCVSSNIGVMAKKRIQLTITIDPKTREIVRREAARYTVIGNQSDYVERCILEKYERDCKARGGR